MTTQYIESIRSFNRFYTDIIGLLDRYILNSKYSLPEVRILFELYHQPGSTAKKIMDSFHIDKGYLSRILVKFRKTKLIVTKTAATDGRSVLLELTGKGKQEFEKLNNASNNHVRSLLTGLSTDSCDELINHMNGIKRILSSQ